MAKEMKKAGLSEMQRGRRCFWLEGETSRMKLAELGFYYLQLTVLYILAPEHGRTCVV